MRECREERRRGEKGEREGKKGRERERGREKERKREREREIFNELVHTVVEDGLKSIGQANKLKIQVRVDITVLSGNWKFRQALYAAMGA